MRFTLLLGIVILHAVVGRSSTEVRHQGSYGDRCPEEVRDANGNYPDYCDDMLLPNGDCLFDDVMMSKAECFKELGPQEYEQRVMRQKENEAKRRRANH